MNALATITAMPETKAQKDNFIQQAKSEMLAGIYPVLDIYARIDLIKKMLDELLKDSEIKDALDNELSAYNEKLIQLGNFDIEKKSKTNYDYSGDMEYNKLKASLKAREAFLKANKCNEDGEVIPTTKTDYITIKVK